MVQCGCVNPLHNFSRPAVCQLATSQRCRLAFPAFCSIDVRLAKLCALLACAGLLLCVSTGFAQPAATLIDLTNATWRFNDSGANLGTAWRAVNFPAENTWPTGRGLFGVENTTPYPYPVPVRTPLLMGAGRTTYYFRTRFNFNGSTVGLNLQASAYIDDGAVIYLNGAEVSRIRLPSGSISFSTKAQLAFPEGVASQISVPTGSLVQGENVLAVELHQYSDTSSDILFGLALEVISSQGPIFLDPAEPASRSVAQDGATTLLAQASGFPPPSFQWYRNGAIFPGAINDSVVIPFMSAADAGSYFCIASNNVGSITSRTAVVTYVPDTNGVVILYALGQGSPTEIQITFSEPPEPGSAVENFDWEVISLDGTESLTVLSGTMFTGTTLILQTEQPRDPNTTYVVRRLTDLPELIDHGNSLPAGSEVVVASFTAPLVLSDEIQTWRYDQSGTDLGTGWTATGFDDSAWLTGLAPFDASRDLAGSVCRTFIPVSPDEVRTCITLSNTTSTAQIPTVYFRTKFNFEGDAAHSILRLETILNDGAVFYLNGVEFLRAGMPEGPISYNTLASRLLGDAIGEVFEAYVPSLVAGENVLAVELHQGNFQSENLTFSVDVYGVLPAQVVVHPRMIIRLNGASAQIIWSPPGGSLEFSEDPSTGWSPVLEIHGSDRHTISISELHRFYRVVMPQ